MFDDLRLDVVKGIVDVTGFLAFALHLVRLGVPLLYRNGILAAELRLRPVDCHSSHDGDNAVFLLTSVHEEQDFECCSHTVLFLVANLVSLR